MYLLKLFIPTLILIILWFPHIVMSQTSSVLALDEFIETLQSQSFNERPPGSNDLIHLKVKQTYFDQIIYDIELHYQDSLNYSLTQKNEGPISFHLTSINGKIKGMLAQLGAKYGYKFTYEGQLHFEEVPMDELHFQCGIDHQHSFQNSPPAIHSNDFDSTINVLNLSSYPSAKHLIYLDFDGEPSLPGWVGYSAPSVDVPKFAVYNIWKAVAEDFISYDVNITTNRQLFDQHEELFKSYVVYAGFNAAWRGVAHMGSYGTGEPVLVDMPRVTDELPNFVLRTGSHELGHALSLNHDGGTTGGYYSGHGEWSPIMGNGDLILSQWSRGEYPSASNKEDDLQIIEGYLGPKSDQDLGIQPMIIENNFVQSHKNFGEILNQNDKDTLMFQLMESGNILLDIEPEYGHFSNLDITAKLFDRSGALIQESSPVGKRGAFLDHALEPGEYLIEIDGGGELSLADGFNDYGSFGRYVLSGRIGFLEPEVDFLISRQNGCVGNTLQLVDQSIGSDLEYQWNFEGANISSSQEMNPEVIYSSPGIYEIELQISNKLNTRSLRKNIHVGSIPVRVELSQEVLDTNLQIQVQSFTEIEQISHSDLKELNDTTLYYEFCAVNDCYDVNVEQIFQPETCEAPIWRRGRAYQGGMKVYHEGVIYQAGWWVNNVTPGEGSPWSKVGDCEVQDQVNRIRWLQLDDRSTLLNLSPLDVGLDMTHSAEICPSGETDESTVSVISQNKLLDSRIQVVQIGNELMVTHKAPHEFYHLKFYNTLGELIQHHYSKKSIVSIESLRSGRYFYQVSNQQNQIQTQGQLK